MKTRGEAAAVGGKYLRNGGAYIFRNNIISSYVFRDSMGLFDYKASIREMIGRGEIVIKRKKSE